MEIQYAIFSGGCFWCTEAVFQRLRGVVSVLPGFCGGNIPNPTYEQVVMGNTGYAEAIKIEFNSDLISFGDLLGVFFATHDPTQLNRQGADVGTQYRSAIFYMSNEQKDRAEKFIEQLESEKIFSNKIVTTLEPTKKFYTAENEHKDYYNQNRNKNPYCQVVIDPKLVKLRERFSHLLV